MNAVDTNILVRFLIKDDQKQAEAANKLINNAEAEKKPLYISLLVILELIWVLEAIYKVEREDILLSLSNLLVMPAFIFEKQPVMREFLTTASQSTFDLADLLIAYTAAESGCKTTFTFDKRAAKFSLFTKLSI